MSLLNDASLVFIPSGYKEDKVYSIIPSNGAGDLDFVRGCDATRINPQSLVENTPWNLLTYSEDFSNTIWSKQNSVTISSNTSIAPNGTLTADTLEKLGGVGGTNYHYIVSSTTSNQISTQFFYVKYKAGSGIIWLLGKNSGTFAYYDIINGVALSKDASMTTSIENVGNGWYKCIFTQDYTSASNYTFGIGVCLADGVPNYNSSSSATQSIYIWGAQSNIGSLKPYFPTTDRLNVPRLTYSPTLIERQSTNFVLYSQEFDNAAWSKVYNGTGVAPVVIANSTNAPDGTLTADTLILDAGAGTTPSDQSQIYQTFSIVNGISYTASFYAKGTVGGEQIMIRHAAGSSYTKITLTNDWQRYSLVETALFTGTGYFEINIRRGLNEPINSSATFYIWGAQLETGALSSYIPTTSTAVTRTATYNSGCPSLLLEKQSTNLALYSEQIDNAAWAKTRATITANATVSPDGTINADLLSDTTFTNSINYTELLTSVSSSQVTLSIFVKKGTAPYIGFGFYDNAYHGFVVDTTNYNVTYTFGSAANFTKQNIGNDWYRLSMTKTASTNFIYSAISVQQNSDGSNYNGTGSLNAYFWGAQLEASSYPTSYIPTTSATATRLADSCSKTGISSLIGQTEGTMFIEVTDIAKREQGRYLFLSDATFTNRIVIYQASGNLNVYCSAGSTFNMTYSIPSGRSKIAFGYKSGLYSLFVNGIERATNTLSSIPANLSAFGIGSSEGNIGTPEPLDSSVSQALLFKRRLTNTELEKLTTL